MIGNCRARGARWTVLLVLWTVGAAASADDLDEMVRAHMQAERIPGLALGIAKDGQPVERRTYGFANLETFSYVRPTTVFRIASISKQFAASCVMLLVQEGKLSLDDPVRKHVPEAPENWAGITVRHLLTHTGGVPSDIPFQFTATYNVKDFFELFAGTEPKFAPGERYEYSNYGYATLGVLVQKVSGKSLRDFAAERLFRPVGMTQTRYWSLADVIEGRANGYRWQGSQYVNLMPLRPWVYDGSGGVLTSLEDLFKWDAALRTESPLTTELRRQMWTRNRLNSGEATTYGFGWVVRNTANGLEVGHSGSSFGFTSRLRRYVDKGVTVIILRNGDGQSAGAFNEFENRVGRWALSRYAADAETFPGAAKLAARR